MDQIYQSQSSSLVPLISDISLVIYGIYYVAGSNPPDDKGNFCDSAHIRPVVATPETPTTGATQKSSWNFGWFTKGGPSTHGPEGV